MSDFQVGDVVVCVDVTTPNRAGELPTTLRIGQIDRVIGVYIGAFGDPGVALENAKPRPGKMGFKAFRFRKLKAADEQFTEQMRALRPAKVSA